MLGDRSPRFDVTAPYRPTDKQTADKNTKYQRTLFVFLLDVFLSLLGLFVSQLACLGNHCYTEAELDKAINVVTLLGMWAIVVSEPLLTNPVNLWSGMSENLSACAGPIK